MILGEILWCIAGAVGIGLVVSAALAVFRDAQTFIPDVNEPGLRRKDSDT